MAGIEVELTATPGPASAFVGWGASAGQVGSCENGSTDNPCSFTTALLAPSITAVFEESLGTPPTVEIDPVDPDAVSATGATFTGAVTPVGDEEEVTWRFEYGPEGTDPSTWSRAPVPDGVIDEDFDIPHDVEVTVDDLEPNTPYEVRLRAESEEGGAQTSPTVQFTTDAVPPTVTPLDPGTGATFAILRGRVNPRNLPTTYWFEYGLTTDYGNFAPGPPPDDAGDAGSDGDPAFVSERIEDLEPETTYHFRLVAQNAEGTTEGPDQTFTTRAVPRFPDRAFELVSPVPTGGVQAGFTSAFAAAADDGDAIRFSTLFDALPGTDEQHDDYISERTADGWMTEPADAAPQGPTWFSGGVVGVPSDFSYVVMQTGSSFDPADQNADPDDQSSQPSGRDLYLRQPGAEPIWLSRDRTVPPGTPQDEIEETPVSLETPHTSFLLSTPQGPVVFFGTQRKLLDEHVSNGPVTYRWKDHGETDPFTGELTAVNILPDGSPSTAPPGGSATSGCSGPSSRHQVPADGSRATFGSQRPGATSSRQGSLYVRMIDEERTVEASAEQGVPPLPSDEPRNTRFCGADEDLSRIFFTAASRLTPDAGAFNSGATEHHDLYAFDVESEELRDLTPRTDGLTDPEVDPDLEDRARVLGVARISDDGRRVYFVADGQLSAEPSPTGEEPSPEGRNLYLAELGARVEDDLKTRFIAALDATTQERDVWRGFSVDRQAHANPDGSVLAFASTANVIPGQPTGGARQTYVYDAEAGTLACASCPADGSPPTGDAPLTGTQSTLRNRVLPDGTAFFHTPTRLLGADQNQVADVYAYNGGEVRLISPGTGTRASRFLDASADGSTVFFNTTQALVPQDTEPGTRKIYAARVGGGFAGPPPPPPPCFGDGCQGDSPDSPESGDLGSRASKGGANLADNRFILGGAKTNRRRGMVRLTVRVPGPGELTLARNGKVRPAARSAGSAGRVRLQVRPTRRATRVLRRKLRRKLRRRADATARARIRIRAEVTFAPEGGEPRTKTRRLRLVRQKTGKSRSQRASRR